MNKCIRGLHKDVQPYNYVRGPYCKLRTEIFFPLIYGPRATRLGHKSTGTMIRNLQYGPKNEVGKILVMG